MAALPIIDGQAADEGASAHNGPASSASAEPRPDIREGDLLPLFVAFYERVAQDPLLAPYFVDVDMAAHMPRIVDFWSTIVFNSGRYSGNAFAPHALMPGLTAEHFAHWLAVLEYTIDARFAGDAAERMKALAHRIAYSMQLRLNIAPFADYRADVR